MGEQPRKMRRVTKLAKAAKITAVTAAAIVGLAVVLFALLLLQPVRDGVLSAALPRIQSALPGDLAVGSTAWPAPGSLQFEGIIWTDGADTLAAVQSLRVSIGLRDLIRRDIHIEELVVENGLADIPSIMGLFPGSEPSEQKPSEGEAGFPRAGSVPGVPSFAVDRLEIDARHVRVSEDLDLRGVVVRARADLRRDEPPQVTVAELSLTESVSGATIDSLWLAADLSTWKFDGNGAIVIPDTRSWYLQCRSDEDQQFHIRVTADSTAVPPATTGIVLEGRADFEDGDLRSVDFKLSFRTPGTEELLDIDAVAHLLSDPLSKIAPLDGLRGTVAGVARMQPAASFDAEMELFRNSWLDSVYAAVKYENETLVIDELNFASPGLALSASAEIPPAGGTAAAHLVLTDSDWIASIVPEASLPDSTTADIWIEADGLTEDSGLKLSVHGKASVGGTVIDTIDIAAEISAGDQKPYVIDALLGAFGTTISTRAQIEVPSAIEIQLKESTIHQGDIQLSGGIGYNPDDKNLKLQELHLSGSLGEHTISAALDGERRGTFTADLQWPEPPPILFARMMADSASLAAADSAWRADGPFGIRVEGDIASPGGGNSPEVTAAADLRLPGPRHLPPLIGAGIAVDDLGPIEGTLTFTTGVCDSGGAFAVRLDLDRTSWIDTCLVDISGCGAKIEIDTVLFGFEHLRLAATGSRVGNELELSAHLGLADSLLLARFLSKSEIPSVSLDADVHFSGTTDAPRIAAELKARTSTADIDIPTIVATAYLENDRLTARMTVPDGIRGYGVIMDSVSLDHSGFVGDSLSGRTTLMARGPDTRTLVAIRWERDGGFAVRGDTLYFSMMKRDLRSKQPFYATVSPDGAVRIDNMVLEGSIGRVVADGYLSPDSADFNAEMILHTPRKPRFLEIADHLWPDSLMITANVDGPTTFHVGALVEGIEIAGQTPVRAKLELHSNPDSTSASATVTSPERRLFEMRGYLPAYHIGNQLGEGAVVLDINIDRLPLPAGLQSLTADKPEILGWLNGRVAVRGTANDPCAIATLQCDFAAGAAGDELAKYRLDFEGELTSRAVEDTALVRLRRDWFRAGSPATRATPGLSAVLTMAKSGDSVLTGQLSYPVSVSLAPFSAVTAGDSEMDFGFKSGAVALTDLNPLLPPDIALEGTCTVDFAATGRADNPSLQGAVRTKDAKIVSARGAQISPDINLNLGGTAVRPSVKGNIQIRSGFLRIPEQQSKLHPAEGQSLLWEAADSAAVAAGTRPGGVIAVEDTLDVPEFASELDLDVTVEIPGSFRIIGSRMNVELSGDLNMVQENDHTILTGTLNALGGQLMFMGRTFELQRGSVNFYGGDEMNPSFNLTLISEVSGYRIEIRLTGTMKDPEITLSSEPQLAEADIMSLLVFGQQRGELSSSQSGLVQQRTAELLMVYGAVKLQEQMSQQMGVDIITVQQSTRKPDESALVVGKYLNSRTLIKYEQNLQNTGSYLVNLEYVLTRRLKLETFVDQASATGIEINWSKDY
jgi:hypothetical protein